jgi:hypothetical protein
VFFLTVVFIGNRRPQFGIGLGEGVLLAEHGGSCGRY